MSGTLRARLERLEQMDGGQETGGLYWLMPVPEPEPLPESYSMGGLTVLYLRPDEAKALCEGRAHG
jgi:hypothetical protein